MKTSSVNKNFNPKYRQNIPDKYDIFRIKSKYERFKQHAYIIIYGSNTFLGKLFDILLLFFIIISVFLVMMESVSNIDARFHTLLIVMEWIITIFFSVEYILRIVSHDHPLRYIFSFYGIVDFISILPMYLSFFLPSTKMLSTIRIFRLLRLFRILSLVNFTEESSKLTKALYLSRTKILVFMYFVLISCVFLGTLMYLIEDRQSGFTSIPRSIYWCIVTLTTVGYGDIAPASTLGQFLASAIMLMGYGILAVPTGIVSAEYSRLRDETSNENAPTLSQTKDTSKRICPNCDNKNHSQKARYCNQCGEMLQVETI